MVMRRMCPCQTVEFTCSCELVTSEVVAVPCESGGVDIGNTGCYVSQGFSLESTLIVKVAHKLVVTLLIHDSLPMLYLLSGINVSYPKEGKHMWLLLTSSPHTQNCMRTQDE